MTKFYKVTDSHGEVHIRSTKSRAYSHAIVVRYPDPYLSGEILSGASWAGRLELAVKQAKANAEIIPAEEITAAEYQVVSKKVAAEWRAYRERREAFFRARTLAGA